ncbi:MAG: 5'-deoxynucleotidase [Desulfurellaceae bacterium]|nr:5'-deoxynucleotidase [Desulfurellaceae bacterium]
MSHLFAYLSRMKFIRRWSLMHSTYPENVQEHSLQVALVTHMLAVIRNRLFSGEVNPERAATLALYHDVGEVLIGDLPTPVKYFNPEIKTAYQTIEQTAVHKLFSMLPEELRDDYQPFFESTDADRDHHELVKAADKLCAYLKCLEEVSAGNQEFSQAEQALKETVERIDLPEVRYFLETFVPSFRLTLDELG